jgi:hypothetical protein
LYSNNFWPETDLHDLLTTARFFIGVPILTGSFPSNDSSEPADRASADIIPFPARAKPAEPQPKDRLVQALASLNAAMEDQRAAVAAWRAVLRELKSTTTELDESLQRYRSNLRSLGTSVLSLHAKAKVLEAWAGGALVE